MAEITSILQPLFSPQDVDALEPIINELLRRTNGQRNKKLHWQPHGRIRWVAELKLTVIPENGITQVGPLCNFTGELEIE